MMTINEAYEVAIKVLRGDFVEVKIAEEAAERIEGILADRRTTYAHRRKKNVSAA